MTIDCIFHYIFFILTHPLAIQANSLWSYWSTMLIWQLFLGPVKNHLDPSMNPCPVLAVSIDSNEIVDYCWSMGKWVAPAQKQVNNHFNNNYLRKLWTQHTLFNVISVKLPCNEPIASCCLIKSPADIPPPPT